VYVAVTVEYRLAREAIFPAAVIDIKNSIKWLKMNSHKYEIDTNRISILGCSAGGQLASLVAYSNDEKDFEDKNYPEISSKVKAVLNIDGLMDFLGEGSEEFDENPDPQNPRAAHQWLGFSQLDRPDLWKKASAIHYIKQNSPPIIFINSSNPRFHAGRDESIKILKNYKIYYEVHTLVNTPHPFWLFHPWFDETLNLILKFLEKIN
jgi:pectinesterase